MKKLIIIVLLPVCLLLIPTSCEETEALLGGNIFNMKYTIVSDTVPTAQVRQWAETSANQLAATSDTFFPVDDPTSLFVDRIEVFGDPNTIQSSIRIFMDRGTGANDHLNTISIELSGPFVEGQEITNGTAIATLGALPGTAGGIDYDFDGSADTYFSFTITSLNTTTRTIGGSFHMLLTRTNNRSADPVSIYEGAFSWNY